MATRLPATTLLSILLFLSLTGPGALAADGAGPGAEALFRRALHAERTGDGSAAREHYEAALRADPDFIPARKALGYVKVNGSWTRKEDVGRPVRWVGKGEAGAASRAAALIETLARTPAEKRKPLRKALDRMERTAVRDGLVASLRSSSAGARRLAIKELVARKEKGAAKALVLRAVTDSVPSLRAAALDAAKKLGHDALPMLVQATGSNDARTRINAAQGMSRLGDVRGVRYLVYRHEERGGGAPRVFAQFAGQLTFIQDFDVEVAATAFIADPIVSTIQEGHVVDARVVATGGSTYSIEREAIHGALRTLTGATEVKDETGAWAAWYRRQPRTGTPATKTTNSQTDSD